MTNICPLIEFQLVLPTKKSEEVRENKSFKVVSSQNFRIIKESVLVVYSLTSRLLEWWHILKLFLRLQITLHTSNRFATVSQPEVSDPNH